MSDAKTRKRERASALGSTHAEAMWLAARMKQGELSEDRVRVAAYAGHTASRSIVSVPIGFRNAKIDDQWEVVDTWSLDGWATGLASLDAPMQGEVACDDSICRKLDTHHENRCNADDTGTTQGDVGPTWWCTVACVGAARLVLPEWEHEQIAASFAERNLGFTGGLRSPRQDLRPRRAIEAAEAWIREPTLKNTKACRSIQRALDNRWVWWDSPLAIIQFGITCPAITEGLLDAAKLHDGAKQAACDALIREALA